MDSAGHVNHHHSVRHRAHGCDSAADSLVEALAPLALGVDLAPAHSKHHSRACHVHASSDTW
jgi:hypothetical protein